MLNRGTQSGVAHTATIAVLATVAVSVGAFFLFTLPASKKKKQEKEAEIEAPAEPEPEPDVVDSGEDPVVPEPEPVPENFRASPEKLLGEIARRLGDGDVAGAHELVGADVGGGREGLAAAFGPLGYMPSPDKAPSEVGLIGDVVRWVMPVIKREDDEEPAAEPTVIDDVETEGGERVFFDLVKKFSDPAIKGWAVQDLHYPEAARALASAAAPDKLSPQKQREQDALIMADGFITAVTGRDFANALQDCTDEVPEEKIAGLCIVFEEGQFTLRKERPLVATALSEDTAWVIAHVESEKLSSATEFGLEMKRRKTEPAGEAPPTGDLVPADGGTTAAAGDPAPADGGTTVPADDPAPADGGTTAVAGDPAPADGGTVPAETEEFNEAEWEIVGINFGKLLDTYVAASEAGRVPYTPIKSDPGSGEKLVLYFEYDTADLLPRAKRQLEIIGNILKADAEKTLTIAGHSDALGSEEYNTALSAARAIAVKTQLVANGVPESQVVTQGFGEAKPWKPELRDDGSDDPKGRSYNRRAEIYLKF